MKDKAHFIISLIKSIIRIISCIISANLKSIYPIALGFLIAEFLGIFEEIFDKR